MDRGEPRERHDGDTRQRRRDHPRRRYHPHRRCTTRDASSPADGASATPTGGASNEPTPTATDDPLATATPIPSGALPAATPTVTAGDPTRTTSPGPGTTPMPNGATPGPAPSFAGGLASTARAKAAVACQRAMLKAGTQLIATRLTKLGSCGRAVLRCIQTKPDDPSCLDTAALRCRGALAGFARADGKQAAALRKRCGGAVELADVLAPEGLGYATLGCGDEVVARSLDDLVECVIGEHACRGAILFALLQPRAKELLRLPGMNAATVDRIACLPDHGGDGAAVGDPAGQGKAVDACAKTIVKTGTGFVRKRLARFAKCADALFSCVQLAPDNGACLAKARARCDQAMAATAADERKLGSTITKRCGEHVIAYATLRAARAANLDALAAGCAAVGVPALESLADYQQCVLRADSCRTDDVLAVQAPRIAELLAVVGRAFGNPYCEP